MRPMILIEGVSPSKGLFLAGVAQVHIGVDTVRKKLFLSWHCGRDANEVNGLMQSPPQLFVIAGATSRLARVGQSFAQGIKRRIRISEQARLEGDTVRSRARDDAVDESDLAYFADVYLALQSREMSGDAVAQFDDAV